MTAQPDITASGDRYSRAARAWSLSLAPSHPLLRPSVCSPWGTCHHREREKYSCDALIVFLDRDPVHVPIQVTQDSVRGLSTKLRTLTKRAEREDMSKELAGFLRKVWD